MTDPAVPPAPAGAPTLVATALKGLCPRCGNATLFAGVLRLEPRCRNCDLDIAGFDVGDGPAAILTLILGTIIVAMAVVLEVKVHPPWWVHLLIWTPITLAAVMLSLRVAKAALIWAEYRARQKGSAVKGRIW